MPAFTGVVAAVRSFRSTGQTPWCREPNGAEDRKSTGRVKLRETKGNPVSLAARDEPPSIVVLSSTVTICVPNFSDGHPPRVSTGMLRDVRDAPKSLIYDAYVQDRDADASCATSFR